MTLLLVTFFKTSLLLTHIAKDVNMSISFKSICQYAFLKLFLIDLLKIVMTDQRLTKSQNVRLSEWLKKGGAFINVKVYFTCSSR